MADGLYKHRKILYSLLVSIVNGKRETLELAYDFYYLMTLKILAHSLHCHFTIKPLFSSFKKPYSRTKDSKSLIYILKCLKWQLEAADQRLQKSLKEKWYSFYTSTTTLLKFCMFSLLLKRKKEIKGVSVRQRN